MGALQRGPGGPWPTQNFGWVGHKWPTMHLAPPIIGLYVSKISLKGKNSYQKRTLVAFLMSYNQYNQALCQFLPCKATLARYVPSPCVCLCVCVCVSVTRRYCIKTAKRRIPVSRLYNVGRRPQIWPTQKFWRGAPYALKRRLNRSRWCWAVELA